MSIFNIFRFGVWGLVYWLGALLLHSACGNAQTRHACGGKQASKTPRKTHACGGKQERHKNATRHATRHTRVEANKNTPPDTPQDTHKARHKTHASELDADLL